MRAASARGCLCGCEIRPARLEHLYNLRNCAPYRAKRIVKNRTVPVKAVKAVKIGVRKAPAPEGRTGFNCIDSVHQGDLDGVKGVYHITSCDTMSHRSSRMIRACSPEKSPPAASFPATDGAGRDTRTLWRRRGLPGARSTVDSRHDSRKYSRMSCWISYPCE